ncbi:probable receptor-like protein kinase At5g39030 [Hibiscus syriacus]|uniref:probable receptor-like protein kinase At5g39030 n=1 Tax=Hibiscus syriacus TaxID=106335 RepID=UPI001922283D|nr:probable receptor-like protein kinase At5g39030 [Hibiscus syriacus]
MASITSRQDHSVSQVPYMNARVFHDEFTYSFQVSPGPKFFRLYFYSTQYFGFDGIASFLSVTANHHLLLSNFSASLTLSGEYDQQASLFKEFMIPCLETEELNVIFSPSFNSSAFVNDIEVVSMFQSQVTTVVKGSVRATKRPSQPGSRGQNFPSYRKP